MVRFDRTPFIVLGILVVSVYACLILYNWSSWRSQYYEEGVHRYRPLVYTKNVKIQEDKRKLFPEREDVFAQPPLTSITLDPIRRASSTANSRKCAQFDVYIYAPNSNSSYLAQRLYKQLTSSRYIIDDPNKACILVAVLDKPEDLNSLTLFKGKEEDHVIYLLNGTLNDIKVGHLYSSDIFGSNGVFLDVEDWVVQKWQPQRPIYSAPRWLTLQIHLDSYDSDNLIVGCEPKSISKDSRCIYTSSMEDITRNQTKFVYIGYKDARKFHTAFYAALLSGSIPVIGAYNLQNLCLSDLVEWDNAVIRAPVNQLNNLLDYLDQLDSNQVMEMRRKGHFYFLNYFADSKVLMRSTLSAIRYRLQIPAPLERAMPAKLMGISKLPNNYTFREPLNLQSSYTSLRNARYVYNIDPTFMDIYSPYDRLWQSKWISNSGPLIGHWNDDNRGMKYSSNLNGNLPDEEFTVLINAYKRDQQLKTVLQRLNGLKFVRYVIVLWCDIERDPPPVDFWPQIHVPIHFILSRNNSLNERFLPYDLVETEAVWSMDDDFEASNEHIEFAFRVWRENRDVLIGPNERLGYTNPITMRGVYKSETECRYNIILTSGAFLHRNYLFSYWNTMPLAVREWIAKVNNCEDIAMNFLVAHLSRKPSIKVTPIFRTSGSFTEGIGLSKKTEHKWNREKCLQVFEEIYGYNPLLLNEYRIDSSHYNHEQKYQCFKDT